MNAQRTGDSIVSVRGASVHRGGRSLVEGIDLDIRRGEIVTLVGPNGSGKSTTAKLVTGVLKPDRGSVTRSERVTVGYVPQKLNIDWTLPLTVRRLMTLTGHHPPAAVASALEAVGIWYLAEAEVQHLSGGEFQRALLARAMIRRPDLLVLDEPVQGVDFSGEVALYQLIKRIRDETQCGVLLISHDLHVVMAETDTVICLNGHICCTGSPESVARSPEYLELFGPRAAATLAIYQHHHDHTHLPDGRLEDAGGHHHADGPDHWHDHGHDHGHGHSREEGRHGYARRLFAPLDGRDA